MGVALDRRALLLGLAGVVVTASPLGAADIKLDLGNATATLVIEGEGDAVLGATIGQWVAKSADAVIGYYGRFPVPAVDIRVRLTDGRGVRGGQTFPGDVPHIRLGAGRLSAADDLLVRDWVLVHEMVHLAFPWMNLRHNWLAEGLAVYVESIARLQAGHLAPQQVWSDFIKMMPRGLPKPGEGGFDDTPTWGRTYWGGAIYCLLADVAIRQQTENRLGLQHALRAINARRDFRREWDFMETLELGDTATGTRVLVSRYEAMRNAPEMTDLDALWLSLGVMLGDGAISFDENAPLSAIRRAIETPQPA